MNLWPADHTSTSEPERHRCRSRFGSRGAASRTSRQEKQEIIYRSATQNVITETVAQESEQEKGVARKVKEIRQVRGHRSSHESLRMR